MREPLKRYRIGEGGEQRSEPFGNEPLATSAGIALQFTPQLDVLGSPPSSLLIELTGVLGLQPGDVLLQAADLAVEELHAMAQPGCGGEGLVVLGAQRRQLGGSRLRLGEGAGGSGRDDGGDALPLDRQIGPPLGSVSPAAK